MAIEQRRRRNGHAAMQNAAGEGAAESREPAAAERAAERAAESRAPAAAERAADEPAAVSAAEAVEEHGDQGQDQASLAIIGQELVAVTDSTQETNEERNQGSERETAVDGAFQTPGERKLVSSPHEQLQLQSIPWNSKNDGSGSKKSEEDLKKVEVPNGHPVSFGPSGSSQLPLFSPEQVAQLSDPRNSTSILPLGREPMHGGDFLRVPGFLQGLFPGYDHVQGLFEARQKELVWRHSMEAMVESLGLELRASRSEN